MSSMDDPKILARLQEIFEGIDNAVVLCADNNERLIMACCMLQKTGEIYEQIMGKEGKRIMFLEAAEL